jgi:hypothetical protein
MHKRKFEDVLFQQPSSSDDDVWKKIWKLDVPPKVRVFFGGGL